MRSAKHSALFGLALAAAFAWRAAATPAVIVVAAIAPAVAYATLIGIAGPRTRERASLLAAAFLCGAVLAASLAATLNEWIGDWVGAAAAPSGQRPFDPVLAAPAVEELAKGLVLLAVVLAARGRFGGLRDFLACGAVVGLGFAASENILYLTLATLQGGYAGLLHGTYLRSFLYGLNHAVFTATTGAGLGMSQQVASRTRVALVALVGWCAAVIQHLAWNAIASERIVDLLCEPAAAGETCRMPPSPWTLYLVAPAIVVLFLGPAAAFLIALARQGGRATKTTKACG